MTKRITLILANLSIAFFCNADDDQGHNSLSSQLSREVADEGGVQSSNPRATNKKLDRQNLREEDSQNLDDEKDQNSPRSNPRWYKSKSGRQDYLKGGGDYPKETSP